MNIAGRQDYNLGMICAGGMGSSNFFRESMI